MRAETEHELLARLSSFGAGERRDALEQLAAHADPPRWRAEVNLHCHSFFSYNACGYSPSRYAWEARRYGLAVAGLVDFDVLDGVAEFLSAGRLLGLKTAAGFESRVFVHGYADREINSPHEPGVMYLAGMGFTGHPPGGTQAERILQAMAECARRRNLVMADKINAHLDPVAIDYEQDVLPLTPAGNATERHMLVAYERRARQLFPDEDRLAGFWSRKLGEPLDGMRPLLEDVAALKDLIRSRLMKHGGVGYAEPEKGRFPNLEDVVAMTLECGAVPSACWLDGTSKGEEDPVKHFERMRSRGIPTVTIIPDRNWNVGDAQQQTRLVHNLHRALEAAADLDMPVLVGTEMNKYGQKFVDTFDTPALASYRGAFLAGAHVIWGHTLLKMTAGVGFTGPWADAHFGDDVSARLEFFTRLGECPFPDRGKLRTLAGQGRGIEPHAALQLIEP